MKYTVKVDINRARNDVIELFDNPDNMKKWQPDLLSFDHLNGSPGQVGASSKLVYKMGNKTIEMIETITERNLPDTFAGTYEANNVFNLVENRFISLGSQSTRWEMDSEFQCKGFMRIMTALFPGAFKKQTLKMMNQFRDFAESN